MRGSQKLCPGDLAESLAVGNSMRLWRSRMTVFMARSFCYWLRSSRRDFLGDSADNPSSRHCSLCQEEVFACLSEPLEESL